MKSPTVLVVEDDPLELRLFMMLVERSGYRALGAASGAVALQILSSERPHALVLDLVMPQMSGLEVLQHVRSVPALSQVRVLVLTAHPGLAIQAYALGIDHWLVKPVAAAQFIEALQEVLSWSASPPY
jgi:two-component system phosphate regulon response regulator PhoB